SIVASVLTLVGIYGVLSLSVAARRREIAIRAAVGAAGRDIRRLVLAEASRLIAGGVVSGIVAAIVLSRVLQSFLFEVSPADPATLVSMGLLFALVALLACWAPTRRAAGVDPLEALRCECRSALVRLKPDTTYVRVRLKPDATYVVSALTYVVSAFTRTSHTGDVPAAA